MGKKKILKELRKKYGKSVLSVKELADELGVHPITIYERKKKKRNIPGWIIVGSREIRFPIIDVASYKHKMASAPTQGASKDILELKNILRDIGVALSFSDGCLMTDRDDNKHVKKLIDKGLMWRQNTQSELAGVTKLEKYLKNIGIS